MSQINSECYVSYTNYYCSIVSCNKRTIRSTMTMGNNYLRRYRNLGLGNLFWDECHVGEPPWERVEIARGSLLHLLLLHRHDAKNGPAIFRHPKIEINRVLTRRKYPMNFVNCCRGVGIKVEKTRPVVFMVWRLVCTILWIVRISISFSIGGRGIICSNSSEL